MDPIRLLYIDLFCGTGGTSTGVNTACIDGSPCAEVIACVNHDAQAIASHAANHPRALHFTEDIRTLELQPLRDHVARCRAQHPDALLVLWASLECTNFSKAKGGLPRDADSRTLAEHLFRYIEALEPDYIQIENVEEFMSWGDMDAAGKPISRDKGKCYLRWVNRVQRYGYQFDYRILNAADYGAYTTRKRFFGIFAKEDLPIVFPEPTHSKQGSRSLFESLSRWKPVREVLDLSDEGVSIFERKKPLAEATLERIYAGLLKFVTGGEDRFLVKYNSMSQSRRYNAPSLQDPCPVVATQNRLGIAKVCFLSKQFSGHPSSKNLSAEGPAGTITCKDHHAVVTVRFIDRKYGHSVDHAAGSPFQPQEGWAREAPLVWTVLETDSPMTVRIKQFMKLHGIRDIKMRMLRISELKRIMGFPENYVLVGTQADQRKFIGNAVEVHMARALCEAICLRLLQTRFRQVS